MSEFTAQPPGGPLVTAAELLARYAAGERDFRKKYLAGIALKGADLSGCDFSGADLCHADLADARLSECCFREADLLETNLNGASLRQADLRDVDLENAQLAGADLTGADLRGANFSGAWLDRCILVGTRRDAGTDLSEVDLTRVICDQPLRQEDHQGTARLAQFEMDHTRYFFRPLMIIGPPSVLGYFIGAMVGMIALRSEQASMMFGIFGGLLGFVPAAIYCYGGTGGTGPDSNSPPEDDDF